MALMPDPANFHPSWFHNRDYGLMAANPFGRNAMKQGELSRVEVKKGERLRLRFGILLHSAAPEKEVDLAAAYREFLGQLPKPALATADIWAPSATSRAASSKAAGAAAEPQSGGRTWAKAPVVANQIADVCHPFGYAGQRLDPASYLGRRVDINFNTGLLRTIDVDDSMKPYVTGEIPKMPSGEYLGKFMQGYSRMYLYSGNADAMSRMKKIVRTMRKARAADGWLGTAGRFVSWDVWEHTYVLLGFLEHYLLTGDPDALEGANRRR